MSPRNRPEYRANMQVRANEIDLDIDRLVRRLDRFADEHHAPEVRLMARDFDGRRSRIRAYMHSKDREATQ